MLALAPLLLLAAAAYSFVVQPVDFQAAVPVNVATQKTITLSWSTDTCAGAVDSAGRAITGGSAHPVQGSCRDSKGQPVTINLNNVFPRGLTTLSLRRGLGSDSISTDLLPTVTNSAALAGSQRQVTVNIANLVSDYYALSLSATDANGNLVRGQSQFFGIQNVAPLPPIGSMQLWSPLPGSYWLAGTEYRIRWEMLQKAIVPDFFHVDLLTSEGLLAARLFEAYPPNTDDTLLGAGRPLNYTIWAIDPALRNKRFKLRITGVFVSNGIIQPVTSTNPTVDSGVFFVGPVKPDTTSQKKK